MTTNGWVRQAVLAVLLLLAWMLRPALVSAQTVMPWDDKNYTMMEDWSSPDTIPPGTKITPQNWKQYERFMPFGMRMAYSGKFFIHFPDDPAHVITTNAYMPIVMPRAYVAATEKYAGQAQLAPYPGGSVTIKNWIAGEPFSFNPTGPDLTYRVIYNVYGDYKPHNLRTEFASIAVDSSNSIHIQNVYTLSFQLHGVTDPGYPLNVPGVGDTYRYVTRSQVITPEQSKYTTALTMLSLDPGRNQEIYTYLPSLRRSLHLSASARCAPNLGSDYLNDDSNGGVGMLIPQFKIRLLGLKKVLSNMRQVDPYAWQADHWTQTMPMPFPHPENGTWELRPTYVLDLTPLPIAGPYCYQHKVLYIDKEYYGSNQWESYDEANNFWKWSVEGGGFFTIPSTGEKALFASTGTFWLYDFQNSHASLSLAGPVRADTNTPLGDQDSAKMATPLGLQDIGR